MCPISPLPAHGYRGWTAVREKSLACPPPSPDDGQSGFPARTGRRRCSQKPSEKSHILQYDILQSPSWLFIRSYIMPAVAVTKFIIQPQKGIKIPAKRSVFFSKWINSRYLWPPYFAGRWWPARTLPPCIRPRSWGQGPAPLRPGSTPLISPVWGCSLLSALCSIYSTFLATS